MEFSPKIGPVKLNFTWDTTFIGKNIKDTSSVIQWFTLQIEGINANHTHVLFISEGIEVKLAQSRKVISEPTRKKADQLFVEGSSCKEIYSLIQKSDFANKKCPFSIDPFRNSPIVRYPLNAASRANQRGVQTNFLPIFFQKPKIDETFFLRNFEKRNYWEDFSFSIQLI